MTQMSVDSIRRILREAKTIAVVGHSTDPSKPGGYVSAYMRQAGYRVIPVNPNAREIQGDVCYPDLMSIPKEIAIDIVNVFRPPRDCPEAARQAAALGAKTLWLQLGIVSEEAARIAEAAGLSVVMDTCIMVEHRRFS